MLVMVLNGKFHKTYDCTYVSIYNFTIILIYYYYSFVERYQVTLSHKFWLMLVDL